MKNLLLLFAVIGFAISCDQVAEWTKFDLDYTASITIPASVSTTTPIDISTPDINTNITQIFSDNNTTKDLIEEIILKELQITLTAPATEDFSFLNEITLYINADNMTEAELAWKRPVDAAAGNVLTLDVSQVDLKEYLKQENFSIKVTATTDEVLSVDHTFDIKPTFTVDAKILGL